MLISSHRFHGHNSLAGVYARGQSVRGPLVGLRYTRQTRRAGYRVAVVVSKKVSKSAVVRNRIRRRLYEIIRRHAQELPSVDLVLTAFNEQLATMPSAKLEHAVTGQLQKAGLLAAPNQPQTPTDMV